MGNDGKFLAMSHGDGLPNLLKYAFNMDLERADSRTMALEGDVGLPGYEVVQSSGGEIAFRLSFLRRRGSGLVYSPMKAATPNPSDFLPMLGKVEVVELNADWERVTITEVCDATNARCFAHVRVSLP